MRRVHLDLASLGVAEYAGAAGAVAVKLLGNPRRELAQEQPAHNLGCLPRWPVRLQCVRRRLSAGSCGKRRCSALRASVGSGLASDMMYTAITKTLTLVYIVAQRAIETEWREWALHRERPK